MGVVIIDNNFAISAEETLTSMGLDPLTFRRQYIKQLVGGIYDCGGGTIRIEFPTGHVQIVRTKNLAKRLDTIFYQLMSPSNRKCQDTWIRKLKAGRQPFSYKEILDLKIQVRKENGNF